MVNLLSICFRHLYSCFNANNDEYEKACILKTLQFLMSSRIVIYVTLKTLMGAGSELWPRNEYAVTRKNY